MSFIFSKIIIELIHEIQQLSAAFVSIIIFYKFQLLSSLYVSFTILQIMWQRMMFFWNRCYLKLHCWNRALKKQKSIQHQILLICKFKIKIWINLLFIITTFYLMNIKLVMCKSWTFYYNCSHIIHRITISFKLISDDWDIMCMWLLSLSNYWMIIFLIL